MNFLQLLYVQDIYIYLYIEYTGRYVRVYLLYRGLYSLCDLILETNVIVSGLIITENPPFNNNNSNNNCT